MALYSEKENGGCPAINAEIEERAVPSQSLGVLESGRRQRGQMGKRIVALRAARAAEAGRFTLEAQ